MLLRWTSIPSLWTSLRNRGCSQQQKKRCPVEQNNRDLAQEGSIQHAPSTQFFISYTQADRRWAEWIGWQLEAEGYTTVIQAWDFRPGKNFVLEMDHALRKADCVMAVLSTDYLEKRFTTDEWTAAYRKGNLLPVRVRECDPTGLLGPLIFIDLVGKSEPDARKTLLDGVKQQRAKPTSPPSFPSVATQTGHEQPQFPKTLPPVWNVPHLRNLNFTGRKDILAGLQETLTSGQPATLTQAITGLGGVGKTQLALEYAYHEMQSYDTVWWIQAEDPVKLAADYAALATPLNLPEREERDQSRVIAAVRRWLEEHSRWLLVFDNAPEKKALLDYLPRGGAGHVIVTSRDPDWDGIAKSLALQVMPPAESVMFLLNRTGEKDEASAVELAAELGGLPLALEQAGAYVKAVGRTLADYLTLFREHRKELLGKGSPLGYPATVATTWDLAFQSLGEAAVDLMNLIAHLAPDQIPREMIVNGARFFPERSSMAVADPLQFDEAMGALRRYSLIEATGEALSIHRLVQAVTLDRLSKADRKVWAAAAVQIVNNAFPNKSSDVQTWAVCDRLFPHAFAAGGHAEGLRVEPQSTGRLLNQAGVYLQGRARFTEAKELFERALTIGEAAFGPNHPDVAIRVNNLGRVLQDLGDIKGAKGCFERALTIDEAARGPNHPTVAIRVNNLGLVLKDLGDLERAKGCLERALTIGEATFGPNHPNVATGVNNLGSVLRDMGDLEGARGCFERALTIGEATFGPNHPNVAIRVNNLGSVLRDMGDLERAKGCFERALKIDEATFGPNHPTVSAHVNNLGLVLQDLRDIEGAKGCFERALKIDEAALGPNHPSVARDVNNLGGVLQTLGDIKGAKGCYERALKIDEAAFGPNHPNVAICVNNLGGVLQDLGDLEGAKGCYERALKILTSSLGPDHPSTRTARKNLETLG